ncbi:MAG: ABC transporter permease, partial [Planctomycetes bacterium]|nr:ABC transporter permease [Planctomycetota bacterium]
MFKFLDATGAWLHGMAVDAGYTMVLLFRSIAALPALVRRIGPTLRQVYIAGVQSLVVTMIVGIFSGMILALQTGMTLRTYHLENLLGTLVLVSLCKELGPFMTAFILAGRVGSAMAAEL